MTARRRQTAEHLGRIGLPPRGLSREEAAGYVGMGASLFDRLVADGRMPPPRRVDGRAIWDRHALDKAFDRLPHDGDQGDGEAGDVWGRVA